LRDELIALRQEANRASSVLGDAAFHLSTGQPIDEAVLSSIAEIGQRVRRLRTAFKEYGDANSFATGQDLEHISFTDLHTILEHFESSAGARRHEVELHLKLLKSFVITAGNSADLDEIAAKVRRDAADLLSLGEVQQGTDLPTPWLDFYTRAHPLATLLAYVEALAAEDFERMDALEEAVDQHYGKRFRRAVSQHRFQLPLGGVAAAAPALGDGAFTPATDLTPPPRFLAPAPDGAAAQLAPAPGTAAEFDDAAAAEPEVHAGGEEEGALQQAVPAGHKYVGEELDAFATRIAEEAERRYATEAPVRSQAIVLKDAPGLGEKVLGPNADMVARSATALLAPDEVGRDAAVATALTLQLWKDGHYGFAWILSTGLPELQSAEHGPLPWLLRAAALTGPQYRPGGPEAEMASTDCQRLLDTFDEWQRLAGYHHWALGIALKPALFAANSSANGLLWCLSEKGTAPAALRNIAKLVYEFGTKEPPLTLGKISIALRSSNRHAILADLAKKANAFLDEAKIRERKTFSAVKVWNSLTQNRAAKTGIVQLLLGPILSPMPDAAGSVSKAARRMQDKDGIAHEIGLAEADVTERDDYAIRILRGSPAWKGLVRDLEYARDLASQWLELTSESESAGHSAILKLQKQFSEAYVEYQAADDAPGETAEELLARQHAESSLAFLSSVLRGETSEWALPLGSAAGYVRDWHLVPELDPDSWAERASEEEAVSVLEFANRSPRLSEAVTALAAADEFEKLSELAAGVRGADPASAGAIDEFAGATLSERWKLLTCHFERVMIALDQSIENALISVERASRMKAELDSIRSHFPPTPWPVGTNAAESVEPTRPDKGFFRKATETLLSIDEMLREERERFVAEARQTIKSPESASPAVHSAFETLICHGEFNKALLLREMIEVGSQAPLSLDAITLREFYPGIVQRVAAAKAKWPIEFADLERFGCTISKSDVAFRELVTEQLEHWRVLGGAVITRQVRGDAALHLQAILEFFGFRVTKPIEFPTTATSQRVDTEITFAETTDRQLCPIPAFGSQSRGRLRIVLLAQRKDALELSSLVGQSSLPTLALLFETLGEEERLKLARVCADTQKKFLLVDNALFAYLITRSANRLRTLMECATPFSYAQPFVSSGGSVPPEMFFGRESQKDGLISMGAPYLVYGGRQLGKTVLLREVERLFNTEKDHVAVWIDLDSFGLGSSQPLDHFWTVLADRLRRENVLPQPPENAEEDSSADEICAQIEAWVKDPGRRLLLLLDEADAVLEEDSRQRLQPDGLLERHPITNRLSGIQSRTNNHFKVIFAGLRNVQRFAYDRNHPIGKLGRALSIGPFTSTSDRWNDQRRELAAAKRLIVEPLRCLGITFESESAVQVVLWATNFYPSLAQIVGEAIVQHCAQSPTAERPVVLTEPVIKEILTSKEVQAEFEHRLKLTLGLDGRFMAVVYSIASMIYDSPDQHSFSGFPQSAIEAVVGKHAGALFPAGTFERTLLDMVEMGILRKAGEWYDLRSPVLLQMLGSYDAITKQLNRGWEGAAEYDPLTYRSPTPGRSGPLELSPLTDAQFQFLVGPIQADRGGRDVTVCCGNEASGLDRLESCLDAHFPPKAKRLWICGPETRYLGDWKTQLQSRLTGRKKHRTFVVLVGPHCEWDNKWLGHALERKYESPVHFLFLADPRKTHEIQHFQSGSNLMALGPWHDSVLRRWLHENRRDDSPSARRLFRENVGLWPGVLARFRSFVSNQHSETEGDLEAFRGLWQETPWEFLRLFGIGRDQELVLATLNLLIEGPASLEELSLFGSEDDHSSSLRWAERLGIVTSEGKTYRLDAFVAKLLAAAQGKE
jgi:hypothetical protein